MLCPKCRRAELIQQNHYRFRCSYVWSKEEYQNNKDIASEDGSCGFQCGLQFFFDDEALSMKLETGIPIDQLKLSKRAQELTETGILALDELERTSQIEDLPSVKTAQSQEDDIEQFTSMMREVVGRSQEVHRQLTSGDSYRKYRSGGLIGFKRG